MTTLLFTWNPDVWRWDDLAEASQQTAGGMPYQTTWSSGNRRQVALDDRVFLLKQGDPPRGIIASGRLTSDTVTEQPHFVAERAAAGDMTLQADVAFDRILDPSVGRILYRLHRMRERNPGVIQKAKEQAKRRHGQLACCVCGFNFAQVYGVLGENYIEGHHTKPLAELAGETEAKVTDIALVCSNCHRIRLRLVPPDLLVQRRIGADRAPDRPVASGQPVAETLLPDFKPPVPLDDRAVRGTGVGEPSADFLPHDPRDEPRQVLVLELDEAVGVGLNATLGRYRPASLVEVVAPEAALRGCRDPAGDVRELRTHQP
jgi:hypothetical protein